MMDVCVKVRDLRQTIGKKVVLNGLSMEVRAGECYGIFATRGTGKTTLLHTLAGILVCKIGQVEVLGYDVRKTGAFKRRIGLVTQEPSLFHDLRMIENLDFMAMLKQARRGDIQRVTQRFELQEYLREPVDALDAGIYQRLSLACALLNSPQLLIADELINDIDIYSRQLLLRELRSFVRAGGACVWGFSQIEQSLLMDRVGWLENGQVIELDPQQALARWRGQIDSLGGAGGELRV